MQCDGHFGQTYMKHMPLSDVSIHWIVLEYVEAIVHLFIKPVEPIETNIIMTKQTQF